MSNDFQRFILNSIKSNDISSICYAILEDLSKTDNYPIKKCQNCEMDFISNSRLDEIYCNYPKKNGKNWKKQAKEKTTKLKHEKLTENEVYEWLQKNK